MDRGLNQGSRILKQIGGALFGALLCVLITVSIQRAEDVVPQALTGSIQLAEDVFFLQGKKDWMFGFWGSYYILQMIALIVGTACGGFAAGCIAKIRGGIWGLISALPTSFFWMLAGRLAFSLMTTWDRVLVFILPVIGLVIGFYSGSFGETIRTENPGIFETRKNTILGIKWYHWLWFIFIIEWTVAFATFSVSQGLWLTFGVKPSAFWRNTAGGIVSLLIYVGVYFLFLGVYKTFWLLSSGYNEGLSKGKIAVRILG